MTIDPDRQARLAAQLRANLARRKLARTTDDANPRPIVDDQRASASDPSDVAAPAAR